MIILIDGNSKLFYKLGNILLPWAVWDVHINTGEVKINRWAGWEEG